MTTVSKDQQMGFEALRQLATAAARGPASREGLIAIADILRDGIGAEQACFVYAEEKEFTTCGDSRCGDKIGTTNRGLWLIQREAQAQKGQVAFNIRDGRVEDLANARAAKGREYVGMRIATSESPSEMVIVRGPWGEGIAPALLTFMEAARPPLIMFLERMLNAARGDRARAQMSALANAAEVLTRSEDTGAVLGNLASAIANSTGYELVSLDLWDEESQSFNARVLNNHRWADTSIGRLWSEVSLMKYDVPALESVRRRQVILMPDLQQHPLVTPESRKYFEWTMVVSAARLPIIFGDEALGSLAFASFQPRTFPPEEVEVMKAIASQLAVALKAIQLYKALAESEERLREYSQQLQASTEIEHRLARTDALTGVPNRRYVEEVIEGECARAIRHKRKLSVGLFDVDGLKKVNDTQGHSAGDEMLIQLAQLARRSCRRGDAVGRYGGDEFLFVLPETGLDAAVKFGDRFRKKVEKHVFHLPNGKSISTTVSLGVAEIDSDGNQKPSELVAAADRGLYEAKQGGRNRVCTFRATERVA